MPIDELHEDAIYDLVSPENIIMNLNDKLKSITCPVCGKIPVAYIDNDEIKINICHDELNDLIDID
jgi:hypothetical protein